MDADDLAGIGTGHPGMRLGMERSDDLIHRLAGGGEERRGGSDMEERSTIHGASVSPGVPPRQIG
jgi:hypothetical protein